MAASGVSWSDILRVPAVYRDVGNPYTRNKLDKVSNVTEATCEMSEILPIHPTQIAKFLSWRPDFSEELIHSCYVVYRGRAVVVDCTVADRDGITAILDKLKAEQ